MIRKLSEAFGPSGYEEEIRELIRSFLPDSCVVETDRFGNLYATKRGTKQSNAKVMLCAHMDEVGLIISKIYEDGTLGFQTVGGMSADCLSGKRVVVGREGVRGVIGSVAVHLLSEDEKKKGIPLSKLVIDIGATDDNEAKKKVSLGDYAVFDTAFSEEADRFMGKALDDRLGCCAVIEVLNKVTPENFDIIACFTAQEETGVRGAKVAAQTIAPDLALVFETTTCNDVPNILPQQRVTELGEGIALSVADAYTLYPATLRERLLSIAEDRNIPVQIKNQTYGGNDCGSISIANEGTPVAVFSVPCRYLHTPLSICSRNDYQAGIDLATSFLEELEKSVWNCSDN